MRLSEFDFDLPDHLIAQRPRERGESRLLVVNRASGTWTEARVVDLPSLLRAGDLLVANDSEVFPARLLGRRAGGGRAECLLMRRADDHVDPHVQPWWALVNPGQRLPVGAVIDFADEARAPGVTLTAEILERAADGSCLVGLVAQGVTVTDAIECLGHMPLPPYIRRPDDAGDRERYQTMFAQTRGSIAAPTAGLHFDAALLQQLAAAGIGHTTVTLHVGYGTFKPVKAEHIEDHRVDGERWTITDDAAERMRTAHAAGARIVAVGTTTTRALETAACTPGFPSAGSGETDLCILPGHQFRAVDVLMTNFHLPKSSLLLLVCAFAGRELVLAAYRDAIARGFTFYSYGDAMLIT